MPATIACPDCEERGHRDDCALCKGKGQVEFRFGKASSVGRFGNSYVKVDNITFDSLSESRHYAHLKTLERNGLIHDLRIHTKFKLYCPGPAGEPLVVAFYESDFDYYDRDGNFHVVDVKGHKTAMYELKKKWMSLQGIHVEEVRV